MREDIQFFYLFLFLLLLAAIKIFGIPLFIVFLGLRLGGVISWSWWLVCIPLMAWAAEMGTELIIRLTDR